jgi:hypothetical protein
MAVPTTTIAPIPKTMKPLGSGIAGAVSDTPVVLPKSDAKLPPNPVPESRIPPSEP